MLGGFVILSFGCLKRIETNNNYVVPRRIGEVSIIII